MSRDERPAGDPATARTGDYRPGSGRAWLFLGLTGACLALDLLFLALSWRTPVPDMWGFRGAMSILALPFAGLGQLLAGRRPNNWIGWLFLVCGLVLVVVGLGGDYAAYALLAQPRTLPGGLLAGWVASWLWPAYLGLMLYALLLFPTGHLLSPRWRPIAWLLLGSMVAWIVTLMLSPGPLWFASYAENPFAIAGSEGALTLLGVLSSAGTGLFSVGLILSLFLRLQRATHIERQQLKWLAYVSVVVSIIGLINVTARLTLGPSINLGPKAFQVLTVAALFAIPLAVGLAILRYRLYEIDLLIRRTLIYGALTATLATVYFGSVLLLQQLFRQLTGQAQGEAVIVLSTLAIAALFAPLHRRIQQVIDRRFYRRKYDAQKVLAVFGAEARDEVDLQKLTAALLAVAQETMQPQHASLWLRDSRPKR